MTEQRIALGKSGEKFAAKFLKKNGYKIKELNYRSPLGEIDIIAQDGDTLVFVEVKTRTSKVFGSPAEAVNSKKRKQIANCARHYLLNKKLKNEAARIDIVSVVLEGKKMQAELIKNAFDVPY